MTTLRMNNGRDNGACRHQKSKRFLLLMKQLISTDGIIDER
ncbi:MAG: hypothetical protein U0796_10790 [Gemmatales bacterium]